MKKLATLLMSAEMALRYAVIAAEETCNPRLHFNPLIVSAQNGSSAALAALWIAAAGVAGKAILQEEAGRLLYLIEDVAHSVLLEEPTVTY